MEVTELLVPDMELLVSDVTDEEVLETLTLVPLLDETRIEDEDVNELDGLNEDTVDEVELVIPDVDVEDCVMALKDVVDDVEKLASELLLEDVDDRDVLETPMLVPGMVDEVGETLPGVPLKIVLEAPPLVSL